MLSVLPVRQCQLRRTYGGPNSARPGTGRPSVAARQARRVASIDRQAIEVDVDAAGVRVCCGGRVLGAAWVRPTEQQQMATVRRRVSQQSKADDTELAGPEKDNVAGADIRRHKDAYASTLVLIRATI